MVDGNPDGYISEEENEHWAEMVEARARKEAIALAGRYLDIIKKDNSSPNYRWNKESHGIIGFITWLQKHEK